MVVKGRGTVHTKLISHFGIDYIYSQYLECDVAYKLDNDIPPPPNRAI
jgi:hypothetical protein